MNTIRTASQLKAAIENAGTGRHFFTRDTMRFFGDTMRNYGVRQNSITNICGESVPVYELYRRRPVKHGMQSSAYFDRRTLKQVFAQQEATQ